MLISSESYKNIKYLDGKNPYVCPKCHGNPQKEGSMTNIRRVCYACNATGIVWDK